VLQYAAIGDARAPVHPRPRTLDLVGRRHQQQRLRGVGQQSAQLLAAAPVRLGPQVDTGRGQAVEADEGGGVGEN
jgi:hypothetical protein